MKKNSIVCKNEKNSELGTQGKSFFQTMEIWRGKGLLHMYLNLFNGVQSGGEKRHFGTCQTKAKIKRYISVIGKVYKNLQEPHIGYFWSVKYTLFFSLHEKSSLPLRISLVNVTKSAVSSGFSHIYRRNPYWKTLLFVQCLLSLKD